MSYFWLREGADLATAYPHATSGQVTAFVAGARLHQPDIYDHARGLDPATVTDPDGDGGAVAYVHPGDGTVIATAGIGSVLVHVHVHASSVRPSGWTIQIDQRETDHPGRRVEDCTAVYLHDGLLWDPEDPRTTTRTSELTGHPTGTRGHTPVWETRTTRPSGEPRRPVSG